jgi:hypothetical protein
MKIHKWKSHNWWLLPILEVSSDSHDTSISIGWWRWHMEFIFLKKLKDCDKVKIEGYEK